MKKLSTDMQKVIASSSPHPQKPKHLNSVFIRTMGCQMNEYDTQKIADLLLSWGIKETKDELEADILLVNTCSVREKAQEKVFHQLGRWRKLKLKKPHIIIGVLGCVASQEGDFILKRAPYTDLILGPQTIHKILDSIEKIITSNSSYVNVEFPEIEKFDNLVKTTSSDYLGYVSIMEGCSKYCSYCIVPYTRGEEFSRSFESVMAEVEHLVSLGSKEIHLLGQNVNAYKATLNDKEIGLDFLIEEIAKIPSVHRIRFTTSHPYEFTDALVETYKKVPKLVSFLHLPLQHASDKILKAMKRDYSISEYRSLVAKLRSARPDIVFSSDFIVGFPDETDEDFSELLSFVKDMHFDTSYSFIYSKRPGTPASSLPDNVSTSTKQARLATLQHLLNNEAQIHQRAMLGQIYEALVEGKSTKKYKDQYQARTPNNKIVNFLYNDTQEIVGKFAKVKIVDATTNSLFGEFIEVIDGNG